ncbi:MAG: CRISPR-associated protein Cas4 [Clostridia bacterium]|nr:CRISPR-associated protein Cas4 [Bacillota bacterium]
MTTEVRVTGTLVWYYYICQREVWLMAHQLEPDSEDENLEYGRFLHQHAYKRDKKEISIGHAVFDLFRKEGNKLVIGEVKKSSRYLESARMQLLFYLRELKRMGVEAYGEIRIPEEKRIVRVELDSESEKELDRAEREILRIIYLEKPPEAKKTHWCRSCAYRQFCWA